ncbi:MAG: dTDP-4-dehydrorhamnose 3,5-epimerase [Spirochaetales bacterium]
MPFKFFACPIEGLALIEPRVFPDDRGFFMETFKESEFLAAGIAGRFVQDNHSLSCRGTLRGLHFQRAPYEQGKLVRVSSGSIWDVAVDLRPESPTLGKWYGLELSAANRRMLYIPAGFAHGFLALEDGTELQYKCTAEYNGPSEAGIRWDDPDLAIDWPSRDVLVSDKDSLLPSWSEWAKAGLFRSLGMV